MQTPDLWHAVEQGGNKQDTSKQFRKQKAEQHVGQEKRIIASLQELVPTALHHCQEAKKLQILSLGPAASGSTGYFIGKMDIVALRLREVLLLFQS